MDSYTCDQCGGEIIFRVIDGVTTPIHLRGGCWGAGDGEGSPGTTRLRYDEDYCHPTTCPRCRASVFFIRHNGGSVWVDELGWPWPKHACFDDPEPFRRLRDSSRILSSPIGGVITLVVFPRDRSYCEITITTPKRDQYTWCLRNIPNPESISGAPVVFSIPQQKLVDPTGRTFSITEAKHCSVCDQLVDLERMDAHMAEIHRAEKCGTCGAYVSREALQQHLRMHPRDRRRR